MPTYYYTETVFWEVSSWGRNNPSPLREKYIRLDRVIQNVALCHLQETPIKYKIQRRKKKSNGKGHEETLGVNEYVYHLDCGDGFMVDTDVKPTNCTPKICVVYWMSVILHERGLRENKRIEMMHQANINSNKEDSSWENYIRQNWLQGKNH